MELQLKFIFQNFNKERILYNYVKGEATGTELFAKQNHTQVLEWYSSNHQEIGI